MASNNPNDVNYVKKIDMGLEPMESKERTSNDLIGEMFTLEYPANTSVNGRGIVRGAYFSGYRQCESLMLLKITKLESELRKEKELNSEIKLKIDFMSLNEDDRKYIMRVCRDLVEIRPRLGYRRGDAD